MCIRKSECVNVPVNTVVRKMAGRTTESRVRERLVIEPIMLSEISEEFQQQLKRHEVSLRSSGLWSFLWELELPWPRQGDLVQFVESALSSKFGEVVVQDKPIPFTTEIVAEITTLPGEGAQSPSFAEVPLNAPQWHSIFEGGGLAFDIESQGWELKKILPEWRDWVLIIQQRIQLGKEDGFMEHCILCAALSAVLKGVRYNWAGELKLRICEEMERHQNMRPMPLLSAGYIGFLCQKFTPAGNVHRNTTPFLQKLHVPVLPIIHSPSGTPEPLITMDRVFERVHERVQMPSESFVIPIGFKIQQRLRITSGETSLEEKSERIELREQLTQVRRELEEQRAMTWTQQEEILQLRETQEELTITFTRKQKEWEQSQSSVDEWKTKCQGLYEELVVLGEAKRAWDSQKIALETEGAQWQSLKVRQERAIASKSREIKGLKGQLESFLTTEKQVIDSREEIEQVKKVVRAQGLELEAWKKKFERVKIGIWAIEGVNPPFTSLYKNFEVQRDIFFIVYNLRPKQRLSVSEFQKLWEEVLADGYENLFTEILVRGELQVTDFMKTFLAIADLGTRVFLYYSQLELALQQQRHQVEAIFTNPPRRIVDVEFWNQAVNTALPIHPTTLLLSWRADLHKCRQSLGADQYLRDTMDASTERLMPADRVDVGPAEYQFKYDHIQERLQRWIMTLDRGRRIEVKLQNQAIFFPPPPNMIQRALQSIRRPPHTPLTHAFLGRYDALFDADIEQPIPSWRALEWLLEDVGLSRVIPTTLEDQHDVVYRRICRGWSLIPPLTVTNDPRFCNCPRRCKWPPHALIDSLEYNWPVVPGSFVSPEDCYESYMRFSYEHRTHQDPVCFRAAVFTAILAFWCRKFDFEYNVNLISKVNREVLFLTKLNYMTSRWHRCLEAMCSTYFIIGPHHTMVNEFGATRFGVVSRALKLQRTVTNAIRPREEVMTPGFVEDYGPSSQRPFKHLPRKRPRH